MTYRAWNLKPLDRAALRELTQAIAEQAAEELEYNAQNMRPPLPPSRRKMPCWRAC